LPKYRFPFATLGGLTTSGYFFRYPLQSTKEEVKLPHRTKHRADEIDQIAGENLKRLRKERNVTREALGKSIGVTFQQIGKYEAGKDRISVSTLCKISKALNVHIMWFLEGIDP